MASVIRTYLVISPLPVVVDDAGSAISYAPTQTFESPENNVSVVRLLEDGKIVETTRPSQNGFTIIVGPQGPTGPGSAGSTLALILLTGNVSGGTDIVVSNGDDLVMGGGAGPSNILWNGSGNIGSATMGQRPDTIYAETSVIVGNTVTITTDTITGSTSLALNANTLATLDGLTAVWVGSFSASPIQLGLGSNYPQAVYEVDPNASITIQPGVAVSPGSYVWITAAFAGTAAAGDILVEGGYGNALQNAGTAYFNGGPANGGPLAGALEARGGEGGSTAAGGASALIGGGSTHASLNAGDAIVRGGFSSAAARCGRILVGDEHTRDIRIGDAASATQTVNMLTGGTIAIRSGGALGIGIGATDYLTISAAGAITAASGAAQDLALGARGANTNFNQAGQTGLHATYTGASRNSIIGAINALVDGTIATPPPTLTSVLASGNTTGANNISVNTGQKIIGAAELTLEATGANIVTVTTNATERARVTSAGCMVLGTAIAQGAAFVASFTPTDKLVVWNDEFTAIRCSVASSTGADAFATFNGLRSRGSHAVPSTVLNNDGITRWLAAAYVGAAGSGYGTPAGVVMEMDAAPSATSSPGRLTLHTTPTGSLNPVERVRVTSLGTAYIGDATLPAAFGGGTGGATIALGAYRTGSQCLVFVDAYSTATALDAGTLLLRRGRGTAATPAAVTSGDAIGRIVFQGTTATDNNEDFAEIRCEADGAVGTNDGPGRLVFFTMADGTGTSVERLRIDNAGRLIVGDDVTTTAAFTVAQVPTDALSVYKNTNSAIRLTIATSTAGDLASFTSMRARGSLTALSSVANDDNVGQWATVAYVGSAGSGYTPVARLVVGMDGVPSATSAPGRFMFMTTPASSLTAVERMRIGNGGHVSITHTTPTAAVGLQRLFVADDSGIAVVKYQSSHASAAAGHYLQRSRGSLSSQTSVVDGDTLGFMSFIGYVSGAGGDGMFGSSSIQGACDGTPTTSYVPGRLVFFTTPVGGVGTERMRINNIGTTFLGDGTLATGFGGSGAASTVLSAYRSGSSASLIVDSYNTVSSADSAYVVLRRARGTSASPAAAVTQDVIGGISFQGATTTTDMRTFGEIRCEADGVVGSVNDAPGRLVFLTTPDGSGTPVERVRITNVNQMRLGSDIVGSADGMTYLANAIPATGTSLVIGANDHISCVEFAAGAGVFPNHYMISTRGTVGGPTATQSGDVLGQWVFSGGGTSGFINGATIRSTAEATFNTVGSANLGFYTNSASAILTERWRIAAAGHFISGADNTYDIGAVGATRPRRVYVGTEVVVGSTITISTDTISGSGNMEVASGASQDLVLRGRGTATNLNQSGQLGLDASYTAASRASLVGALNSLVDGSVGRPPEVYTTNEGEVAILEATLPAAVLGEAERSYYVENSNGIELTAAPGEFVRLGSVIGLGIRGEVAGTLLVLRPINGTWIVKTITGAWTMLGEDAFEDATALWQLDDGVTDSTGNGYNLTFAGSTNYDPGKIGNAANVGGGNYLWDAANALPSMQSSDFTIMGWVNVPSLPGDNMSVFNRGTGGFNDMRCYIHSDGRVDFWANSSIMQTAAGKITAGVWHHIVVRRIGTAWQLRVDNVVSATHTGSITINSNGGLHFSILGSALGSGQQLPANSLMDQWAVYTGTGIDNADIDAIYNVGNGVLSNETPIAGADAV